MKKFNTQGKIGCGVGGDKVWDGGVDGDANANGDDVDIGWGVRMEGEEYQMIQKREMWERTPCYLSNFEQNINVENK